MRKTAELKGSFIRDHLFSFIFSENNGLFEAERRQTIVEYLGIGDSVYPKFINEFWTSKQRQANSLHEISYRACFKPQLPHFFINLLTKPEDTVYDPFSGRGTTVLEAAILGRNVIANDINPLSRILTRPRFFIPDIWEIEARLALIPVKGDSRPDLDLSMFYHPETEAEIISLRDYLKQRSDNGEEDEIDSWIRMVATNRLTGHSGGFFSVYTLPPNQAVSQESQKRINEKRKLKPEYRDTKNLILRKTKSLLRDMNQPLAKRLRAIGNKGLFLAEDARSTKQIKDNAVALTATSPPFLNVVQYDDDNWLRCWFNSMEASDIGVKITMLKDIHDWCEVMGKVFEELYRITKKRGHVAFEVGEVRGGMIRLEEYVIPLGTMAGFDCEGIMINEQEFTKTANIWGISNNKKGTNTNRIAIFCKR